jgi:LysR family cyn operon transcriptional activator
MKNRDQQVRLFLAIAQHQSLSRAADALGLTQSGVSRQLSSLEAYLGQALFERHGRGVTLTDAGKKLEAVAQPAYEWVDDTVLRLREQQGLTEGSLRIATIHTLSYYFVADVMAQFMAQRPLVSVTMLGRSSPDVVDMVETGKADIGFVYDTAVVSDTVDITTLFEETMAFFVHEQSAFARLEAVDLHQHRAPLIVFPQQYALRRMLQAQGLEVSVAAEVDTVDAMLKLTSLTCGQCVLPASMPDTLLRDYQLKRLPIITPGLSRRIVAITRRGKLQTAFSRLMLDIAQASRR